MKWISLAPVVSVGGLMMGAVMFRFGQGRWLQLTWRYQRRRKVEKIKEAA